MITSNIVLKLDGVYEAAFRTFGIKVVAREGVQEKTPEIVKAMIRTLPEYKALVEETE